MLRHPRHPASRHGDNPLTLSFLDVLSCGLGAMLFVFLLAGARARGTGEAVQSEIEADAGEDPAAGARDGFGSAYGGARLLEVEIAVHGPGPATGEFPGLEGPSGDRPRALAFQSAWPEEELSVFTLLLPTGPVFGKTFEFRLGPQAASRRIAISAVCGANRWPSDFAPAPEVNLPPDTALRVFLLEDGRIAAEPGLPAAAAFQRVCLP
ncbi:MAG: hypothetical protein IPP07_07880 [Holophagales bacterium]|nr:hypothetical protein [Holophagales bacterium]MBK9964818.1 hypothetical protein [Holophagales bacterium]